MRAGRRLPPALALGALGVAGAAVAAAVALWRALVLGSLPTAREPTPPADGAALAQRAVARESHVLAAIAEDPFAPARRRPAVRFRLPHEAVAAHHSGGDGAGPSAVRVIGTAVLPDGGGFAICQRTGGAATLVRLGGTLGDWTLTAVEPGAATFTTSGGATFVVRVVKLGGGS